MIYQLYLYLRMSLNICGFFVCQILSKVYRRFDHVTNDEKYDGIPYWFLHLHGTHYLYCCVSDLMTGNEEERKTSRMNGRFFYGPGMAPV
ncbi:hypothetical protein ABN09_12210 [Morganella morganii]|nr:hypothetical protein ABN09_12210 [Morganella morganii]